VLNLFCYDYNNDVIFPTSPAGLRVIFYNVVNFTFSIYFRDVFLDFIVILQEYELSYEDGSHQVWLHCTNWSYCHLLLSNIDLHSRQINFPSGPISW